MLWHVELAIECFLLALLWYRDAPNWFCVLIGTDCCAQLLQIILYRAEKLELARVVSRGGYVLIAIFCFLAVIESAEMESSWLKFWHARILALWIAGAKLCGWMEVGQPDNVVFWWNGALLAVQSIAFGAWITLFALE